MALVPRRPRSHDRSDGRTASNGGAGALCVGVLGCLESDNAGGEEEEAAGE